MKPKAIHLSGTVCLALMMSISGHAVGQQIDWIAIDGGCFEMGESRFYPEEMPPRDVCVDAFEMTRTEITVAQFAEFVRDTGYKTRAEVGWTGDEAQGPGVKLPKGGAVFDPPEGRRPRNLNWWRWNEDVSWDDPTGKDAPAQANHPVTFVTFADAEAFAKWSGGRLPTEAEWEYAARGGPDGELIAWDAAEVKSMKDKANTWQGVFPIANTQDDGFAGVAPVASFPENGFGLHDMIGNVWEWTATPYAPSHSDRDRARAGANGLDPSQPGIPVGTIKGGSFLCAPSYCFRFRSAARQAQDLFYGTSHIGFRVVRGRQQKNQ